MAVVANEKLDEDETNPNPLGLDTSEIALLDSQVEAGVSDAGYLAIYRYADRLDQFVMAASTVFAVAAGATMPLMTVGLLLLGPVL
jgi:ATP-binding cassette subfamily B (MDR/TAP) protein 1